VREQRSIGSGELVEAADDVEFAGVEQPAHDLDGGELGATGGFVGQCCCRDQGGYRRHVHANNCTQGV